MAISKEVLEKRQKATKKLQKVVDAKALFLLKALSSVSGYTVKELLHASHTQHLMSYRYCLWKALKESGCTYEQIGFAVSRDHSTIINKFRNYAARAEDDTLVIKLGKLVKKWEKENLED